MSGKDEKPNREEEVYWTGPTIEQYREDIQHVLTWMNTLGLNFNVGYTFVELAGFVQMSGVMGTMRWVDMIARGVRRAIDEMHIGNPEVFYYSEGPRNVG